MKNFSVVTSNGVFIVSGDAFCVKESGCGALTLSVQINGYDVAYFNVWHGIFESQTEKTGVE